MDYASKITELRKTANLTQTELGEKLNVTAQAVSKWENGLSEPDLETIHKLCEMFNISANEFFGTVEDKLAEPKVVEQKIINGYCEKCSKPVGPNEYKIKTVTVTHRTGRHHTTSSTQHLYCNECYAKIEKQEREAAEKARQEKIAADKAQNKKELNRGLIWGGIVAVITLISFIVYITGLADVAAGDIVLTVLVPYGLFALVSQLFWCGSVVDVLLFFCRSFKMPGVIFTLDWDGIAWLIAVKIAFAILSAVLSVVLFLCGAVFTACYAGIIFPFALPKKIKGNL